MMISTLRKQHLRILLVTTLALVFGALPSSARAQEWVYRLVEGSLSHFEGETHEMTGEFRVDPSARSAPRKPEGQHYYFVYDVTDFVFEAGQDVMVPYEQLEYEGLRSVGFEPSANLQHFFTGTLWFQGYTGGGKVERVSQEEIENQWSHTCERRAIGCEQVLERRIFLVANTLAAPTFDRGGGADLPARFRFGGGMEEQTVRSYVQRYPCGLEPSSEIPSPSYCNGLYQTYPWDTRDVGTFQFVAARVAPAEIEVRIYRARRVVRVAVFGSDELDVTDVDIASLRLGPDGAPPMGAQGSPMHRVRDVNGDGVEDLVVAFRTRRTGLGWHDEEACLEGDLADGSLLEGCDFVEVRRKLRRRDR